jgi:hypothetical protein
VLPPGEAAKPSVLISAASNEDEKINMTGRPALRRGDNGVRRLAYRCHSIRRVETQSIRAVAMGSIARLSHQATSSPELWLSR